MLALVSASLRARQTVPRIESPDGRRFRLLLTALASAFSPFDMTCSVAFS